MKTITLILNYNFSPSISKPFLRLYLPAARVCELNSWAFSELADGNQRKAHVYFYTHTRLHVQLFQ